MAKSKQRPLHKLRAYRLLRDLTCEELGEEWGVTGVAIGAWENGKRKIGPKTVAMISARTGLPISYLRPDLDFGSLLAVDSAAAE